MSLSQAETFEWLRNRVEELEKELERLKSELAQARQQAIAECARIVFDEGYEAVAHRMRSLTPPPALSKTCIGYEGGCDGNLTGEPHEANCPKFAPPALTKEK